MISIKVKSKDEIEIDKMYVERIEIHYIFKKTFEIDFYEIFFKEQYRDLMKLIFKKEGTR